jgi:hypothetical protein
MRPRVCLALRFFLKNNSIDGRNLRLISGLIGPDFILETLEKDR